MNLRVALHHRQRRGPEFRRFRLLAEQHEEVQYRVYHAEARL